jgi:1-acyl-sn-glycerol-3-phosphate acyltransferase
MISTMLKAFLIVSFTIPISLAALISIPLQKSGRFYHACARIWARFALFLFGIRVHVRGLEHVVRNRSVIYVSNHASLFDIPAVLVGIPDQIRIVLKKELTRIPLWGWALKYGHYISIDREKAKDALKSLEKAAERMRVGASVLLFAEGTRSQNGMLQPFKRGAFTLAVKSRVPIVPVTIKNSFGILPKGSLKVQPHDIELVLSAPVPTEHVEGKEQELQLMKKVHSIIEDHFER